MTLSPYEQVKYHRAWEYHVREETTIPRHWRSVTCAPYPGPSRERITISAGLYGPAVWPVLSHTLTMLALRIYWQIRNVGRVSSEIALLWNDHGSATAVDALTSGGPGSVWHV